MITTGQLIDLDEPLEAYLVALFESSGDLCGGELRRSPDLCDALIYSAWDEIAQRTMLRVIVAEPLCSFSDLTLDLSDYLRRERQAIREDQIAQYVAEGQPIGEAQAAASAYADGFAPDHIQLYLLESGVDDGVRIADLLGMFAPEIVLHIVPDALVDGGAA